MARKNSRPMFRSLTMIPGATGSTANDIKHRHHDDGRSQDEHGLVRERRNPVFFHEDLDDVGHDLKQAERSDAIGAVAVLPQGEQPPLEPDQAGRDGERDDQNAEDRERSGYGLRHVILTIFPQAGNVDPGEGGSPAGRPATPRRQVASDADGQPERPAGTASFDLSSTSAKIAGIDGTCGVAASSAMPGAERLSSSEPKM